MPSKHIDHINGIPSDNRWSNLREVTEAENHQNLHRPNKNNQVGILGVTKKGNRFVASIQTDGNRVRLRGFTTAEAAGEAYKREKRERHIASK